MEKRCIHLYLYTGNGKGKTTTALGVAVGAVSVGKKVFIGQFVKGIQYTEIMAINKYLPTIEHQQYGLTYFIEKEPTSADIKQAKIGF